MSEQDPAQITELDLSDVDHRVGQPVGGGQLWDPCSSSDIRRWVMAMDYPNPPHRDEEFARDSRFGGLGHALPGRAHGAPEIGKGAPLRSARYRSCATSR